jgi:hypothetical protein
MVEGFDVLTSSAQVEGVSVDSQIRQPATSHGHLSVTVLLHKSPVKSGVVGGRKSVAEK